MITMTIAHENGDREISLSANTMRELVDEKLPKYLPNLIEELPLLKQTSRFKKNPVREEELERESGWYYYS